jgi:hypothetical protein
MLYDDPPHAISLYSSTNAKDAGAGTKTTYHLEQAACPCLINTASANTRLLFAQMQIAVTHTIGILSSALTATPQNGWKVVADDTGASFKIEGIRSGRVSAMGTIPALTYLDVSQLL